jgi:hypothetical protein
MRTIAILAAALFGTESSCANVEPFSAPAFGAPTRSGANEDARDARPEPAAITDPAVFRRTPLAAGEFRVEPRAITWDALDTETFAPTWLLPEGRVDGGVDLLADMRALLALAIEEAGTGRTLTFGDLVLEARPLALEQRRAWFAALAERTPAFHAAWGARIEQLLFDDTLYSERWKPSRDEPRDGLLFAPSWSLEDDTRLTWQPREGHVQLEQAAALFFADTTAIKAAENDYRLYPKNIAADYETIHPLDGAYVRGVDADGRGFSAHQLYFRCDLPFPFSDYECRLHVLTRERENELVTDIFSASKDFHSMCGRDVFLPVTTSAGATIATLAVRTFGFDIAGVPDDADNRREAMRGSIGNLRRNSERIFSAAGGVFRAGAGVPEYEVLGLVPK